MKKNSILVLGFSVIMAVLQVAAETPAPNKRAPVNYDNLFKLFPKSTTCLIAADPAKFPIQIEDPKLTGILKKSEIDPEKDIHAIMMGLTGPPIGKGRRRFSSSA
ncbi:MAG: hypothetical protein MUQ25_18345 [Candidatus Aminicenantes bacterium]|nr:hypothetical protein [Candidatus Aminicenantes bacterium]